VKQACAPRHSACVTLARLGWVAAVRLDESALISIESHGWPTAG
jgi:hypothetical protein